MEFLAQIFGGYEPLDLYYIVLDFFDRPEVQEALSKIKFAALLFSVVTLALIVVLNKKIGETVGQISKKAGVTPEPEMPKGRPPQTMERFNQMWLEIERKMESNEPAHWKVAIIEADNLVDEILKEEYVGKDMGERLKQIDKSQLLTIDDLWEAHKVRNNIVHNSQYYLDLRQARRVIELYKRTLKEMAAIDLE